MRKALRIAGMVLAVAAVLAVGLFGLGYTFVHKFTPEPPAMDYAKPSGALEAQRQDFDYLEKLVALDRSYSPAARAQVHRRLSAFAASSEVLDRGHMRVAVAGIAALADNGHTSFYSREPTRPFLLPIRLASFSDGLYVMRVEKKNSDLLGAQVVAVDGRPVVEVLAKIAGLRGGTKAWRLNYAQWMLNSSEFLYGAGIAPAADRSTWTFRTRGGGTVERTFTGAQPKYDVPSPDLWRWQSPEMLKGDTPDMVAFKPDGWKAPVTFQDPDADFRRVRLAGSCAMLIQLKANAGKDIGAFLSATEADLANGKPCAIIFDNRFNGGGDYTNTAGFAGRLHSLVAPGGRIYILTGSDTFSAGITTAIFIKQAAAPGQVVILGEPVGDRLVFWAEGGSGCLPNAPFCFHYSAGLHDYAHKCSDWDKCFWLNWIYPARTDNLTPRETITQSHADYLAGRDPAFERALALAAR